ncbi:MAG: AarF/ABC1/UbiB kinase family protein, partial [Pseudomonadota bacterium]
MTQDDIDKNSMMGRVGRYARVSTTVGGLAAKLAGQKYFGRNIDRPEHAKDLTLALGNLKGPLLKVAQLLATIPQALPAEYAQELQQLQSDA